MGLLDDFSRREAKAEPKPEPPAVGHYGVKLDLKEEKVSLTAGQTKEYPVVVTNTGTEDDTIRIKVDLVYNSERSEEHTSELQSRLHLVCRLLLEKKKNITKIF